MQRNHLCPQQILTIFEALWDGDDLLAGIVDDGIRAPDAVAVPAFHDFEPAEADISKILFLLRCLRRLD